MPVTTLYLAFSFLYESMNSVNFILGKKVLYPCLALPGKGAPPSDPLRIKEWVDAMIQTIDQWIDGCMDGKGRVEEWWMDGWMDQSTNISLKYIQIC